MLQTLWMWQQPRLSFEALFLLKEANLLYLATKPIILPTLTRQQESWLDAYRTYDSQSNCIEPVKWITLRTNSLLRASNVLTPKTLLCIAMAYAIRKKWVWLPMERIGSNAAVALSFGRKQSLNVLVVIANYDSNSGTLEPQNERYTLHSSARPLSLH